MKKKDLLIALTFIISFTTLATLWLFVAPWYMYVIFFLGKISGYGLKALFEEEDRENYEREIYNRVNRRLKRMCDKCERTRTY